MENSKTNKEIRNRETVFYKICLEFRRGTEEQRFTKIVWNSQKNSEVGMALIHNVFLKNKQTNKPKKKKKHLEFRDKYGNEV